ncbi:hypothetical protein chiPu_0027461, partial [Chiloscyllium punctatum]|nr:hypothetical protein [Chiloscyllium punctatum]
ETPRERDCETPREGDCETPREKGCQNLGESGCDSDCETPEERGCGAPRERGCESTGKRDCGNPGEGDCQNPGAGTQLRHTRGQLEKEGGQQLCSSTDEAYPSRIRENGYPLKRSYGETKVNLRLVQESMAAGCEQGEARPRQRGRPAGRGCLKRPRRQCTVTVSDAQTQTDKSSGRCSPGHSSSSSFSLPSTSGQSRPRPRPRRRPRPGPARRKGSIHTSSQSLVAGEGRASSAEGEEEDDNDDDDDDEEEDDEEEEEMGSSRSSQCSTPSSVSCSEEQAAAGLKQAGGPSVATELVLARPPGRALAVAGPLGCRPHGDRRKTSSGRSPANVERTWRRRSPVPSSQPQRSQDNWGCLIF